MMTKQMLLGKKNYLSRAFCLPAIFMRIFLNFHFSFPNETWGVGHMRQRPGEVDSVSKQISIVLQTESILLFQNRLISGVTCVDLAPVLKLFM